MKRLLLCLGLLLLGAAPACGDTVVTYQNCKHQAQFAAFIKSIPPAYTHYNSTHWVVVEYPSAKWSLACKIYGATGDPKTFQGVTFLTTHIILIEDTGDKNPDIAALGTFIHETGHFIFWPAISDCTFPGYADSLDALFQHEYDVLGRDTMPPDADVQEAWCEELRHSQTPGDKAAVSVWGKSYFPQLFSPTGPVPPLMPVPDNYITPPTDEVPPGGFAGS